MFGTFTQDLVAMAEWLSSWGILEVAIQFMRGVLDPGVRGTSPHFSQVASEGSEMSVFARVERESGRASVPVGTSSTLAIFNAANIGRSAAVSW